MENNILKEKIISESIELFMKYGLRSVTMDDIAKHMGISKKTIYMHFKDKEEIITIAAHTHNHGVLSRLSEDEVAEEAIRSKNILKEKLNHEINHFSYPFGSEDEATEREYKIISKLGFDTATTTIAGRYKLNESSLYCLPRVSITSRTSIKNLRCKINGWNTLWGGVQF